MQFAPLGRSGMPGQACGLLRPVLPVVRADMTTRMRSFAPEAMEHGRTISRTLGYAGG
jgi:hypothetical protein